MASANDALETKSEVSAARRRRGSDLALAHYLAGLGHLGLGETEEAKAELREALRSEPDLLGAKTELVATH